MISTYLSRLCLLGIFLLPACNNSKTLQSIEGYAQGTTFHISYWSEVKIDRKLLSQAVNEELARIDASMSNYRSDSTLEKFNSQNSTEAQWVDAEIVTLVEKALSVNKASNGCYDLTVKGLFDLWGFSNDQFSVPEPDAIQEILKNTGMNKLEVIDNNHLRKELASIKIDISSIGQGYSVARIASVMEKFGIQNYLVEIGGEMLVRGKKPDGQSWRIAIEKPLPEQRAIEKVITLKQSEPLAVMTSGTYRHFYDEKGIRYSHILDARSGYPVTHATVSVTVIYPDAALADAWSTALLCLGTEAGITIANVQQIPALFIDQKNGEPSGNKFKETRSLPLQQWQGVTIE